MSRIKYYNKDTKSWVLADNAPKLGVDTTLTKSGKAADAKAVGDKINKKLDEAKLPEAVNDALTKAKESGEFDGPQGDPGDITPEFIELSNRVKQSEVNAGNSANSADTDAKAAAQALSDLIAMLGTDVATLVGGKIPMSQIPATATQEVYEITSEDDLVDLIAQRADLAELVEDIDGVKTITKTWQLLGDGNPAIKSNWIVWGTSYAVQAGNATTADNAENANKINGHRIVLMTDEQYELAVKDPDTYYLVITGGDTK